MSKDTLTGLRDYLFATLSKDNILWLAFELQNYVNKEEELKPYTTDEIRQMIEEGEKQVERGEYYTTDEVFRKYEKYMQLETA